MRQISELTHNHEIRPDKVRKRENFQVYGILEYMKFINPVVP